MFGLCGHQTAKTMRRNLPQIIQFPRTFYGGAPIQARDTVGAPKQKAIPSEGARAGCPLCTNGLDRFGYRDVLLLRQFLNPDGYLIGRRNTGICPKMQRRIAKAVKRSRKMGLLPNSQSSSTQDAKS